MLPSLTLVLTCCACPVQKVWEGQFLGKPVIIKQRFSKQYRHPVLDSKLTVGRLNQACFLLGQHSQQSCPKAC